MKVNYSFILLTLFSLYIGYINYLLLFIIALLIHELGHILFIKIFKTKINSFHLSIYGGCLQLNVYEYNNLSKIKKIIIYISGISMNFLFFIVFYNTLFSKFNLILLLFNLLPIYPLDGYNILKIIIKDKIKLNNIMIIFLVILLIISIYYNSLGIFFIVIVLIIKNIMYFIKKDKQYLYNLMKNMI